MVPVIIKTVPAGDFEEISIHMPDWKTKFLSLALQGKHIKYYVHTMPTIPKDIFAELRGMRYFDLILEGECRQHFLIPRSD